MADNRRQADELKNEIETEKALKLKAEEEKRALDVTKTEFV